MVNESKNDGKQKSSGDKSKEGDEGMATLEQIKTGVGMALDGFGLDKPLVDGGKDIASGVARIGDYLGEGTFLDRMVDRDG